MFQELIEEILSEKHRIIVTQPVRRDAHFAAGMA